MKKHLFIISFILVMLLAISTVSASDSNDVADDSAISEASLSDCVQSVDGEVESTVGEQQNDVDVLSEDGNNQTPADRVCVPSTSMSLLLSRLHPYRFGPRTAEPDEAPAHGKFSLPNLCWQDKTVLG